MASKDPPDRIAIQGGQIGWIEAIDRFAAHGLVPLSDPWREPSPGSPTLQIRAPILHKQYAGCCNEHCNDCRGGHQHNGCCAGRNAQLPRKCHDTATQPNPCYLGR